MITAISAFSQNADSLIDRQLIFDIINISAIILVVYLVSSFILQIIRQNFEFRIKNKLIEKGVEEPIVRQMVQPPKKDQQHLVLQWFFVLAGIAVGFTLMQFTRPFGLHSLAIMAFSIAAGFGGYFLATKKSGDH